MKINKSSPYVFGANSTSKVMYGVLFCMLPGLLGYFYFIGGYLFLIQVFLMVGICMAMEAFCLRLRGKNVDQAFDGSAVLTAVFLMLCLPPWVGIHVLVIGALFAIVFVKHLYGGLGHNFLNPAMMGYAVLLIAFPNDLSNWPSTYALFDSGFFKPWGYDFDMLSSATPLAQGRIDAIDKNHLFVMPSIFSIGWMVVNLLFGFGGLFLLLFRLIDWRIPFFVFLGFVLFLVLDVFVFKGFGFEQTCMILQNHFFSGSLFLGAFFIATDPVSAATSSLGRVLYGTLIGVLIYAIRSYGNYPDGVAFAVLIGNMIVPLIDIYIKPRVYGH